MLATARSSQPRAARPSRRPGPGALTLALALALAGAAGLTGCGDDEGDTDGDDALQGGDAARGAERYLAMCAQCHGPTGQGGEGPPLANWSRGATALISAIETTMPAAAPEACAGQCPIDIAAYILGGFDAEPISCDEGAARRGRRQLRLLTRREYTNTVRDLLERTSEGGVEPTPDSCALDTDCALTSESCVGDVCVADPCELHTFVFDPQGATYGAVHVAGSFNGWPATLAAGGWPMVYVPEAGVWVSKQVLGDGEHQYKFVLDESEWVHDAANPDSADDGNGGLNSLLTQDCAGAPDPAPDSGGVDDPAADFPLESRPDGFFFDNNAGAGLVTAVHVEQYMRAAEELAALAVADLDALLPCTAGDSDETCADRFVREFGARALRRPLREDEVARYTARLLAAPNLEAGVSVTLQVLLSSPYFLYRFELGEPAGDGYRLTAYETASALSYLLWGSMPDDELMDAAAQGALSSPAQIEAQARRLLEDPRARELVEIFAEQWLGVESVATLDKSASLFPGFTEDVRAAMSQETRRFFSHVVFDGGHGYDELLTADYSFADDPLAAHYGVAGPGGGAGALEAISLPPERAGLLGHGSVLASTAHSDQSSPVRRGLWVRRRLLCQELGQPPPDAGGVPEVDPDATTRERFRQHSEGAGCFSCHQFIDELGFGFERFDAAGRYREQENGKPVDPSGVLNDVERLGAGTETAFTDLRGLGQALVASQNAKSCFARQYYRFASGALEQGEDACALADIEQRWAAQGYDIRELIIAITRSPAFTDRQ